MQTVFTNRIAELVDEETPPGGPEAAIADRSAAQREASRKNGAKSRGPKTAEGKSRSRLNSLRHGLLARVVCPPADGRGDDRLYRRIRRELVDELKPKGFTDQVTIDGLAGDLVQLGRVRRMIEELQRPPATAVTSAAMPDAERWGKIRETRGAIKLLTRLQRSRGPFNLKPGEAARIAARLEAFVAGVRADWADFQADADEQEEDYDDEKGEAPPAGGGPAAGTTEIPVSAGDVAFEAEEDRLLVELAALIGDAGDRLCDRSYLTAVLAGRGRTRKGDLARLRALSGHAAAAARQWLNGQRDFIKKADGVQSASLRSQAQAPEQLMVLTRYLRAIERGIDEKLRRFKAW